MNDEINFANKIRQLLSEGARLEGARGLRIAERLRASRERALERRKVARETSLAWARSTADNVTGGLRGTGGFSLRLLLAAALLVAGLVAIYGGQQEQNAADVEELDTRLLTDVLPIDAYLDRRFEAWLKKVSADQN